jgi:hypothetical protein
MHHVVKGGLSPRAMAAATASGFESSTQPQGRFTNTSRVSP